MHDIDHCYSAICALEGKVDVIESKIDEVIDMLVSFCMVSELIRENSINIENVLDSINVSNKEVQNEFNKLRLDLQDQRASLEILENTHKEIVGKECAR